MDGQEGEAAAPEGDSDRLTEMGDDDQRQLVHSLKTTRDTIQNILADRENSSMSAEERLEHDWNLWLINGLLLNTHQFATLNNTKIAMSSKGLGPDHTYQCLQR